MHTEFKNKVIEKFGDNVSTLNRGFKQLELKMDKLLERLEARDKENMELRSALENSELRSLRLELELLRSKTGDKSLTSPRNHGDAGDKPPAPFSFLPCCWYITPCLFSLSSLSLSPLSVSRSCSTSSLSISLACVGVRTCVSDDLIPSLSLCTKYSLPPLPRSLV